MAGTGSPSPFIKDEPEDQFFNNQNNQRYMSGSSQGFNMSQQHFNQFGGQSGSINPNDLTMGNNGMNIPTNGYGSSFQQNNHFSHNQSIPNSGFSKGISTFDDDELLDSLGTINGHNQNGMQNNGQFYGMDFDGQQNMYNGTAPLSVDPNHISGYSNTPDGDPIQSPFAPSFTQAQFRHMQTSGGMLQSPGSYTGSPINGSDMRRPRLAGVQGRKPSSSSMRSPLTPKTPVISSLNIGSAEHSSFPSQPIRTNAAHRHQKTLSGQWDQTPSSLQSYPGSSEYGSPIHGIHPNPQISDILKGASMPTKLNQTATTPAMQSQEMKRRRRRESHNLVERRRRDNINERIQELSHLVPMHRLEDEKLRKALQNNSPLSPTLAGLSHPPSGMSPPQATSGLAGPGARRATAGNITTGIPIEEKDKGPNKGDILNGAVSWTRDLMWMLHQKLQQQEELANLLADANIPFPFEETEDEKRMHTELLDAMQKNEGGSFHYSRTPGSGLRVPKHTDLKGDPVGLGVPNNHQLDSSLSPDNDIGQSGLGGNGQFWSHQNSGGSGAGSISFKEEDEYMDL